MEKAIKNKIIDDYWIKKLSDKKTYIHSIADSFSNKQTVINNSELLNFYKVTKNNSLAKLTIITSIYLCLLKKYFFDFDDLICLINGWEDGRSQKMPLILELSEEKDLFFKNYIFKTKSEVQNCLKHKNYQSDKLFDKLNVKSLTSFSPFGLNIGNDNIEEGFRLVLSLESLHDKSIVFSLNYDNNFIQPYLIEHFAKNFVKMLTNFNDILNVPLSEIEILNLKEKNQILNQFNDTAISYPRNKSIIDLFEKQVKQSPDNVAIVFEDKKLTYSEINSMANRLGRYLRENYKVKANDILGVKLDRSDLMIIAIYGILKSGAAYVPIDSNYPQKRIDFIKTDTNCKVVIDSVEIESFLKQESNYSSSNLTKISSHSDLAYVIYTSGTTGYPKGVMIENTSVVNRLAWMQKAYSICENDILIQKTTYSFDVSVWEIFWWSLYGAKLTIPLPRIEKDPDLLVQHIFENRVSVIHFVPSALTLFIEFLKGKPEKKKLMLSIKQVFVSGEPLTEAQKRDFTNLLPDTSLMNLYGPTETTIDVSYFNCSRNYEYNPPPIGKPIDNIKLYILDKQNNPVPIGVVGKLFISGVGLSRGYINNKKLTEQKFVTNPFDLNSKMYDSGDLAKWLPDGNIEYVGRMDNQIKFRGYRIELGEIEKVLTEQPEVSHAIVDLKLFNENKVLTAYLIWNKDMEIEKANLSIRLQEFLPKYMIPTFYINLESLPVKENGKLKRSSLPALQEGDTIQRLYKAPLNNLQKEIVKIWQEVLGIEKIGITDSFFELGGHSLMVTQIINRISKKVNKTISVKDFLLLVTIEKIEKELKSENYDEISNASDYEETII